MLQVVKCILKPVTLFHLSGLVPNDSSFHHSFIFTVYKRNCLCSVVAVKRLPALHFSRCFGIAYLDLFENRISI